MQQFRFAGWGCCALALLGQEVLLRWLGTNLFRSALS
jgi:hypothetical protein